MCSRFGRRSYSCKSGDNYAITANDNILVLNNLPTASYKEINTKKIY